MVPATELLLEPSVELEDIWEHTLDLDGSNSLGAPQWTRSSLRAWHNLSSLHYGAWRSWALRLRDDDAAFARLMSPQQCADEIDAAFAVCKASYLCAKLEPEARPYAVCLKRVRAQAVTPPGWSPAVKRAP